MTYFPLFKLWPPLWLFTPNFMFGVFINLLSPLYCRFAYLSPLCQLYSPLSHFFLDYIFLFIYYSHIVCLIFALLFPLNVSISASSTSSSLHLLLSISPIQLYDLGSPADSQSSSPGCLTTDSSCVNMGYPSCGHRGRCHGEWGSFSCQCVPGYTGHQCEEGELIFIFIYLFIFCTCVFKDYIKVVLDSTSKWWQNHPSVHERYFTPWPNTYANVKLKHSW